MKQIRIIAALGAVVLSSCASLTKSQLNEVNVFGQLTVNLNCIRAKSYLL